MVDWIGSGCRGGGDGGAGGVGGVADGAGDGDAAAVVADAVGAVPAPTSGMQATVASVAAQASSTKRMGGMRILQRENGPEVATSLLQTRPRRSFARLDPPGRLPAGGAGL